MDSEDKEFKEMYGHLPHYGLFAQHQGDYLNESDWLDIVKIIREEAVNDYIKHLTEGHLKDTKK